MVSQRNTIFKYLSALIATFSIALFGLSSVHVSASNTPDLAIAPVYSANQRAKNGIFDLSVKPDTNQKLQLKIANLSKKDQKIEIVPTTAYTSNGGAIALDRRKVPSEPSLKVKFTDLVDKKDQTKIVNIPANETKTVSFEIHIPKKPFDGVVVGGLHVQTIDGNEGTTKKGVSLKNRFAYSMAVVLKENKKTARGNIKLGTIKPGKVSNQIKIKSKFINDKPAVISGLRVKTQITEKGKSKLVGETSQKGMSMAPNSNFTFLNNWRSNQIKPGTYHLKANFKTDDGQHWQVDKNFTVSVTEATVLNAHDHPWLKTALLVMLLLLLFVIAYVWKKEYEKRHNLLS
ncbi:DUF916 and DUF3324 domain-containing protein [Weissella viridescens]|uniref:DUF916 and DUF3324 domain-containing protein n=2 Tax=Weissella TaxID=46255 RepID=UPI003AF30F8B